MSLFFWVVTTCCGCERVYSALSGTCSEDRSLNPIIHSRRHLGDDKTFLYPSCEALNGQPGRVLQGHYSVDSVVAKRPQLAICLLLSETPPPKLLDMYTAGWTLVGWGLWKSILHWDLLVGWGESSRKQWKDGWFETSGVHFIDNACSDRNHDPMLR